MPRSKKTVFNSNDRIGGKMNQMLESIDTKNYELEDIATAYKFIIDSVPKDNPNYKKMRKNYFKFLIKARLEKNRISRSRKNY